MKLNILNSKTFYRINSIFKAKKVKQTGTKKNFETHLVCKN